MQPKESLSLARVNSGILKRITSYNAEQSSEEL